jgi:TonB family protein
MVARFRPAPFLVSLLTHGLILAWVASGPVRDNAKSLYAKSIAPHSSKLVWYNFREKLPDVSPSPARHSTKPPRAEEKLASQEIVAGSPTAPRAKQFVWQPAPKLEIHADLQSPNVLAIGVPRAAAPAVRAPKPRAFVPPPEAPKSAAPAPAPSAPPEIQTARNLSGPGNLLGAQPVKAPPRKFIAPHVGGPVAKPQPTLPDAPMVAAAPNPAAAGLIPLGSGVARAPPRDFVAPRNSGPSGAAVSALPDAPALRESISPPAVSMAIVGLNPRADAKAPVPEGSRNVQLAAGPKPRIGGTDGLADGALLTVPGLLIHSGVTDAKPTLVARAAPTSAGNLRAALHGSLPKALTTGAHPAAIRVSSAPDPMWSGRDTYAMSVQMANITSYTGSWMIWFAEHDQPEGGARLSQPVPVRKVDPKYFPAAIASRVEGKVRLAAVIRKNGRVDSVRLLQHLDDRLDRSAQDALEKWEFEPALRDGQPVDVDAVIEIPFRLAPKVPR